MTRKSGIGLRQILHPKLHNYRYNPQQIGESITDATLYRIGAALVKKSDDLSTAVEPVVVEHRPSPKRPLVREEDEARSAAE